MNEAIATILVAGAVQIIGMIIGFLTLWLKAHDASDKADKAAVKATSVEEKIDENTRKTESVELKTDTIVKQTNGVTEVLQSSVDQLLGRVEKLEGYSREASHRLLDAVHASNIKIAELVARTPYPALPPLPKDEDKETSN